jgi:hypothetical protein
MVIKGYDDLRVAMKKLREKMIQQYQANPENPKFDLSLEPNSTK